MNGSAMSKSRGNLVRLSEQLDEHGVDAIRLTMAFAGPPEDDIDWADVSPAASAKFLARAWRIANDVGASTETVKNLGQVGDENLRHQDLGLVRSGFGLQGVDGRQHLAGLALHVLPGHFGDLPGQIHRAVVDGDF